VAPDRPGLFSRITGALALHGLEVLDAMAHSDSQGMAASEFRVQARRETSIRWSEVTATLERALRGRLALEARLADRARAYDRRAPRSALPVVPSVTIDNGASSDATVIEVRAADATGLLHRITRALAEMDLDIRHAKVATLGHEVVDSFYVRDGSGAKVTDPDDLAEVQRALLHAMSGASTHGGAK
jgi:[protein-PII] uridylyltransferase